MSDRKPTIHEFHLAQLQSFDTALEGAGLWQPGPTYDVNTPKESQAFQATIDVPPDTPRFQIIAVSQRPPLSPETPGLQVRLWSVAPRQLLGTLGIQGMGLPYCRPCTKETNETDLFNVIDFATKQTMSE